MHSKTRACSIVEKCQERFAWGIKKKPEDQFDQSGSVILDVDPAVPVIAPAVPVIAPAAPVIDSAATVID